MIGLVRDDDVCVTSLIDALIRAAAEGAYARAVGLSGPPSTFTPPALHSYLAGMTLRRFGDLVESLLYDVRYAGRALRRHRTFTVVASLSIALGVAANTTVFSVVNAVLLRPISGAHADGLVRVYVNHHSPFSWRDLAWFRERAASFRYLVGERLTTMTLRANPGADLERVRTAYATQGYFAALGVHMALGRPFDGDENTSAGAEPTAVLSYGLWQRRFGADSGVIGRTITLGNQTVTVIGVAAPDFRSSVVGWAPELWVPLAAAPVLSGVRLEDFGGSLYTTARLRRGVSSDAAEAELRLLMAQLARTDSARYERMTVRLDHVRGVNAELRGGVTAASAFVMTMVALVLLIACANVANLLLGRATARRSEIGVRLAIGASRGRLVRQMLVESLLLAALGGALGFAGAWAVTRLLPAAIPAEAGVDTRFFAPDGRVLLFTGALCLVTTLLFGLAPALRASSPRLTAMLKGDSDARGRRPRRGALVASQAALCVVLLAVASLFLRSLSDVRELDPGFRADGVVDVTIDLGLLGDDEATQRAMFARIMEQARALPGVRSASLAAIVPLAGSNMEVRVGPEGMETLSRLDQPVAYFNIVGSDYFATLGIPLLRGRGILETDTPMSARVAVINETAARRWWPRDDAVGKRFRWGGAGGAEIQVVGIARNADYVMPGEAPKPVIYMPLAQQHRAEMVLQLLTTAGLPATRDAVWRMLRTLAPSLPPPPVVRMTDDMAITLLPVRAGAVVLGAFGILALVLAGAGIYGVTAYSVARRTREIGIRSALGATRGRVVGMVLWESLRTVGVGGAIGLALAIGAAAGLSRVLYGVRPVDPLVMPAVLALIALVAVIASLAPARRAAAIDPVTAMRVE
jgi:putative ABC transport system permease protein